MNFNILAIVLLGLFAWGSTSWAQVNWIPEKERVLAKMSGDFKTADGSKVSLHDLKSRVVFLNFWATWCSFCKEEMPWLMELSKKFSSQGLQVIAATNEDPKIVRRFLEEKDFSYPILLDIGDTLIDRFKVETVPTTVVIDPESRVAFRVNSFFRWDSPETIIAIEEFLNEGKEPTTQ
jgi:thiol-disulfide isomerase/thioredoxin